MEQLAELLQAMKSEGIVLDYAVFGAVAQMRYTEPVATLDVAVLVALPDKTSLAALSPVYRFCEGKGFLPEGEAIRVGRWPVQFIPVFSSLTEEAVREAETGDLDGAPIRVIGAAHLAVIALSVGRPKDLLRIHSLLNAKAVTNEKVENLAERHGLLDQWRKFERKFLDEGD
jgi:hypothetical protein